jgi:hypothetical protein
VPLLNNNVMVVGNDAVAGTFSATRAIMDTQLHGFHTSAVAHARDVSAPAETCRLVADGDPQPIISTGTAEGHAQPVKTTAAAAAELPMPSEESIPKMSDPEIVKLVESGQLPHYNLERSLKDDLTRAVSIRRQYMGRWRQHSCGLLSCRALIGCVCFFSLSCRAQVGAQVTGRASVHGLRLESGDGRLRRERHWVRSLFVSVCVIVDMSSFTNACGLVTFRFLWVWRVPCCWMVTSTSCRCRRPRAV